MRRTSDLSVRRAITRFVAPALALGTGVALAPFASFGLGDPFPTFFAFILVTELLDTALPSGRRLSLSLAPGLAFAMLDAGQPGTEPATVGLTFLGASLLAAGVRLATRREVRLHDSIWAFFVVTAAAATYDALAATGPGLTGTDGLRLASATGLVAVLALTLLSEPARASAGALLSREPGAGRALFARLRLTVPLQVAIVSVAALVSLAFPKLQGWSFPLFLGPLAATRYAFRQITQIRRTEVQTLRALSKIPEMAGYTQPGHSRRVAEMSCAMAAELGVPEDELREIEYAALLHDIGRVVLEDPESERAAAGLQTEVSETGANIVAAAGTFPRVAAMIREQHAPYRRRGETVSVEVPLGARILRVANTYDDLVRPGTFGRSPWDVLEHLHSGQAYEFDPECVSALARVLSRAGTI